jgi:undecaprenyl-diphosphatase
VTLIHSIIIAILQGISELFPVSSLGHAVLLPKLLHWGIDQKNPSWLAFLVALHLGTAVALLVYFRDEWISVVRALVRSVQHGRMTGDADERLAWMVILGTLPAGLVGFVLEHPLRNLFGSPYAAAVFLAINGLLMVVGERLLQRQLANRERKATRVYAVSGSNAVATYPVEEEEEALGRYRDITELGWRDAAIVGFAQVAALFPGISRSGVTMVAGLAAGLTHEASARYTFLLATPIIGAAAVLEIPQLFEPSGRAVLDDALIGMVLAGIAAYLSVRYLMRYFQGGRLYPFAFYCCTAGVLSLFWLTLHTG